MKTFTLDCHPGTKWQVKVFVHRTKQDMFKARLKVARDENPTCVAFAYEYPTTKRFDNGLIGEMHFFFDKGHVPSANIVHECAHIAVAYMSHCRLDFNHHTADEHFAECMEHLVEGTTNGIKMDFRKKTK